MGRRAEIELLEHLESRLQQHKHTEDQTHYLSRNDVNTLVRWGNIALGLTPDRCYHALNGYNRCANCDPREEGEK